jgi:antitoxin HicB
MKTKVSSPLPPDLPGCSCFGETQAEALAELKPAIEAWIEAARAANNPIPDPSDPALRSRYSGKVLVRMPRELHARLTGAAKSEEVSLNHYIVYLLSTASAYLSNQQTYSRALTRSLQVVEFAPTFFFEFSRGQHCSRRSGLTYSR